MIPFLLGLLLSLLALPLAPARLWAAEELCVSPPRANVRQAPSLQAPVLKTKSQGERVLVLGRSGGWMQVALSQGGSAWMHSSVLAPCGTRAAPGGPAPLAPEVQQRALRFLVQVNTLRAGGAGVVLSADGRELLTAHHVASAGRPGPPSGVILVRNEIAAEWILADLVRAWPELDLALYRTRRALPGSAAAPLGSAGRLARGAAVHALGYPSEGLAVASGPYAGPGGILSLPSGTFGACVRPGFSGGPALTSTGEVVGIVLRSAGQGACAARFLRAEAVIQALSPAGMAGSVPAAGLLHGLAELEGLMLELAHWARTVNATPREGWWDAFCGQGWWHEQLVSLEAAMQAAEGRADLRLALLQAVGQFLAVERAKADYCRAPEDGGAELGDEGRWARFTQALGALHGRWLQVQGTRLP